MSRKCKVTLDQYIKVYKAHPHEASITLLHLTLIIAKMPDFLRDILSDEAIGLMADQKVCTAEELEQAYKLITDLIEQTAETADEQQITE